MNSYVHHANKTGSAYRGPTDLLASVDVSIEVSKAADEADGARLKVYREKVRDGRSGDTKVIRTIWSHDLTGRTQFNVEHVGDAPSGVIDDTSMKILSVLARKGSTPQTKVADVLNVHRTTVSGRCGRLEGAGLIEEVNRVNNSPVWRITDEGRVCAEGLET